MVLVVGAGPTGLTLAIELARRSVPFRIIDAASGPFSGSRGKGVQPRTQEIFDHLGIIDALSKHAGLYQRLRFHVGPFSFRGGSLGTRHPPSESVPYPNLVQVPQFRTEEVLRARLEGLGGRVEHGVGFQDLTQDETGVHVTTSTGETLKVAYLVGCDGGRSRVRKALGLALAGEAVDGQTLLVADVKIDGLSREDWHVYPFAPGGTLGLCPLPHTDVFQVTATEAASRRGLVSTIERASKHRVTEVSWESLYTPQVRMVDRYRVGRVFLAGDAAHVHSPAGGQGLNTGVQDAWNLGWKLAWAARGGPDSILDSYEDERLPIAAAVLRLSKRLHVKRSMKRGALTNQLGIHYRESKLSRGRPLGDLHPGDRVADARLPGGRRLYDFLRGTGATQLTRSDGFKVLVRPDGYVASIGRDAIDMYAGEPVQQVSVG
ncbi:putative monooxygenase [Minicystis rosea]|nr:putative monooxygenase [Minicystis rosea]